MKRRTVLSGIAGLSLSASFTMGTGAFSTANTDRSVNVEVVDDDEAYLKLEQRGGGERSEVDGFRGTLEFSFPGDDESEYPATNPTDPKGLGPNSTYRFAQDAAGIESGLFSVKNQGTHPIKVYSTQAQTSDIPSVTIFNIETGNLLNESNPSGILSVGEQIVCGLEIDTHGVTPRNEPYEVSLSIHGNAVNK